MMMLSLLLVLYLNSSFAAILLNFDKETKKSPSIARFIFKGLGAATTTRVSSSPASFTFSLSERQIGNTSGALSLTLVSRGIPTTAERWKFGPKSEISQKDDGLGVQSSGGSSKRIEGEEAVLLSFDTSLLTLDRGAELTFRVLLSGKRESSRVYERTNRNEGTIVANLSSDQYSSPIRIGSGYESRAGVFDFAIADAGFIEGNANRIGSILIDVDADSGGGLTLPLFPPLPSPTPPTGGSTKGPLKIANVFTDNMVLQRRQSVSVYGTGTTGKVISVSFAGQVSRATVDSDGNWLAILGSMGPSTTGRVLRYTDGDTTRQIDNVVVGDVWLASGQSNMDREWKWYKSLDAGDEGSRRDIRILGVEATLSRKPLDEPVLEDRKFDGGWQSVEPKYLRECSPAAYFFAKELNGVLDIPIGILESAQGATRAELWTPPDTLKKLGYPLVGTNGQGFNGMIYPLRKFTFKGIIWYQGESNAKDPEEYDDLFPGLIEGWRDAFGNGNLPFYFAQIASLSIRSFDKSGDQASARLREAQSKALRLPNTRMVVTIDIGELNDIHPQDKQTVGERFAYHALEAEGVPGYSGQVPELQMAESSRNELILTFTGNVKMAKVVMNRRPNLKPRTDPNAIVISANSLSGFTVSDGSENFFPADAEIDGNRVILTSSRVNNPKEARYCWMSFGECNLFSTKRDSLPISPFRTDSFRVKVA